MIDQRLTVGTPDDISPQSARVVHTEQGPIAIFKTAEGKLFALLDRCPHKGGPLSEGLVHGCKVACPLHGWNIHLDSGQAVSPDEGEVTRFPLEVQDGRLYLGLTPLRRT